MYTCACILYILLYCNCYIYAYTYVVFKQRPMDTTVCQGANATFTCEVFIKSGAANSPTWIRNNETLNKTRHMTTISTTDKTMYPVNISTTVTVIHVTVCDDNGTKYECGVGENVSDAMLYVEGKCILLVSFDIY